MNLNIQRFSVLMMLLIYKAGTVRGCQRSWTDSSPANLWNPRTEAAIASWEETEARNRELEEENRRLRRHLAEADESPG